MKVRPKRTRRPRLLADDVQLLFPPFLLAHFLPSPAVTFPSPPPLLPRCMLPSSQLPRSLSLCLLQLKQHALLLLVKRNQVRCFCEVWSPSTSYCVVNSVSRPQRGVKDTVACAAYFWS